MGRGGTVLVTGGTAAARALAETMAAAGWPVVYALAGITAHPRLPRHPGVRVRRGGFGGAEGLARWLRQQDIAALVDATHPHARTMPQQALKAARLAGVPHLRYLPPPPPLPRDARILPVADVATMAALLPRGARVFAALGSRGLAVLSARGDVRLSARMRTPPACPTPPRWRLVIGAEGAPRASMATELALLRALRAQFLLARHSTGSRHIVHAAARLGLPVLLAKRPAPPAGARLAGSPQEVLRWLTGMNA